MLYFVKVVLGVFFLVIFYIIKIKKKYNFMQDIIWSGYPKTDSLFTVLKTCR